MWHVTNVTCDQCNNSCWRGSQQTRHVSCFWRFWASASALPWSLYLFFRSSLLYCTFHASSRASFFLRSGSMYKHLEKQKRKEKCTPLGVMTGVFVPKDSLNSNICNMGTDSQTLLSKPDRHISTKFWSLHCLKQKLSAGIHHELLPQHQRTSTAWKSYTMKNKTGTCAPDLKQTWDWPQVLKW